MNEKFVVFVDAGHGGIDPKMGKYTTSGKRAYHAGLPMHDGKGNYYEGVENRIVADAVCAALAANGIQSVRVHHPFADSQDGGSAELQRRAALVNDYLAAGYTGYLHSFHSNAIGGDAAKMEQTQGFCVFTTVGQTHSDKLAEKLWDYTKIAFPEWNVRSQMSDGDRDHEENFYIIRSVACPAILEEFGFHTSRKDAEFIMANRSARVQNAVKLAIWARDNWEGL